MNKEVNKSSTPLLEIKEVSKYYGNIKALDNVSFELNNHEILGLLGDNGAGKSTLIKILRGAHKPTNGQLLLRGKEVSFSSPHDASENGIECIYQESATVEELNVAENFFLGKEATRLRYFVDSDFMKQKTHQELADMGFEMEPTKKVRSLSGGQRRAISVVRALSFEPDLLLLDEPFTALSEKAKARVINLLEKVREDCSMIFVTHSFDDAVRITDRFVALKQGKVSYITNSNEEITREEILQHI